MLSFFISEIVRRRILSMVLQYAIERISLLTQKLFGFYTLYT